MTLILRKIQKSPHTSAVRVELRGLFMCDTVLNRSTGSFARYKLALVFVSLLFAACSLGGDLEAWREKAVEANGNGQRLPTFEMTAVPAGDFTADGTTQVTISGFFMGKYQVTQEQYQAVMGINPSQFQSNPAGGEIQERRPVERVSWYDAVEFCNKLSVLEGRTPVYTITGRTPASGYPITAAEVTANWSNKGYRLPTEAEWEYACRAGTSTTYNNTGGSINDNTGWYNGNSGDRTHEVGKKSYNSFGLYDMHGNVREWCWDLCVGWEGVYPSGVTNPTGPSSGTYRVHRGGSWDDIGTFLGSAERAFNSPSTRNSSTGFRLVRPSDAPAPVITITTQPASLTDITAGSISESLNISAEVTLGGTLSYQWYYENVSPVNTDGYAIPGATNPVFPIPTTLTVGTYYYFCELAVVGGMGYTRSEVATVNVTGNVEFEMVWVPAGSFELGKGSSGGVPNWHAVTFSSGFYIGKYPITQLQYQIVMDVNPSNFSNNPALGETQNRRPVEMVSWYDALVFCNKLSIIEGLSPAYRIAGSTNPADWGAVPENNDETWDAVEIVLGSAGYRLPTEAQWEYAAKGGDGSPGNFTYSGSNNPDEVAWYGVSTGGTHEVGKKAPNGLGIYDMSGNVREWCWDWYGSYTSGSKTDPMGASSGEDRVFRGGAFWNSPYDNLTSIYRNYFYPKTRTSDLGFRLARPSEDPVITITAQPAGTIVLAGNISGALSVSADVPDGSLLSYQWYSNTNDAYTGSSSLLGETSASFDIPTTLIEGTYYYYCTISATGGAPSVNSNVAAITVKEAGLSSLFELVWVAPGIFTMGSNVSLDENAKPAHQVTLTKGHYIGKYPVTLEQYREVTGYEGAYNGPAADGEAHDKRPVERVSWNYAVDFCNKLSEKEGLMPVYTITGGTVTVNWDAIGFRLPTEAEWEFAARGGNESEGYVYAGSNSSEDAGWYSSNSHYGTHEVGKKTANELGIYDMSGNVYEWCWDWFGSYSSEAQTDPRGKGSGNDRVLRGGSCLSYYNYMETTYRAYDKPYESYNSYGFRVLLNAPEGIVGAGP